MRKMISVIFVKYGVMDNQFATEIILENGKALKFDDIGCMYKWMDDQ